MSEDDSSLHIGVEGTTEEDAVANFAKALLEWERLRLLPDLDRTPDEVYVS
ncbi:MAG: hypothetical protein ACKVUT_04415 [Gaiella sp.]